MSITFGPILSRRFGLSLGIDLSPGAKACNFDCLYCELSAAKPTDTIPNPPSLLEVVAAVKEALAEHPDTEVITITANGEPTLYPYLNELIDALQSIKGERKLLILSNASTIDDPKIRKTLAKLDIVKLSLDCATKRCFKRLDRPLDADRLGSIIAGMREFRKDFCGTLVIEILVVQGINDTDEEFKALAKVLKEIHPDRVDIGTIDRPPAYAVQPVTYERLESLAEHLVGLPVAIVAKRPKPAKQHFNREDILAMLARRPLTQEDVETLFDTASIDTLHRLLQEGTITKRSLNTTTFYTLAS